MTMEFRNPLEFAKVLFELAVIHHAEDEALEEAGKVVEAEAKRVIGTYDYGWPSLAPSTIARKGADTPLLETGEMRDSIAHNVDASSVGHGRSAFVGSDNDKAIYHEYGTSRIPPRPFLSRALIEKEHEVVAIIGQEIAAHIRGVRKP